MIKPLFCHIPSDKENPPLSFPPGEIKDPLNVIDESNEAETKADINADIKAETKADTQEGESDIEEEEETQEGESDRKEVEEEEQYGYDDYNPEIADGFNYTRSKQREAELETLLKLETLFKGDADQKEDKAEGKANTQEGGAEKDPTDVKEKEKEKVKPKTKVKPKSKSKSKSKKVSENEVESSQLDGGEAEDFTDEYINKVLNELAGYSTSGDNAEDDPESNMKSESDAGDKPKVKSKIVGTTFDPFNPPKDKDEDPDAKAKYYFPSFFFMNPTEVKRYQNTMKYLRRKLNKMNMETAFLVELICRDRNQSWNFVKGTDSHTDWRNLCSDPIVLLEAIWKETTNHPMFVALPASVADPALLYYQYNDGKRKEDCPPFDKISHEQVILEVGQWISSLFNRKPPGYYGTYTFQHKLVEQLAKKHWTIQASSFVDAYPSGIAGKNGYYFSDHISPLLRYVAYGPEIIVKTIFKTSPPLLSVMPDDRKAILDAESVETYPKLNTKTFSVNFNLQETVRKTSISFEEFIKIGDNEKWLKENLKQLNKYWRESNFLDYVYNICNHKDINVLIFRTLCQRAIMAPTEGLNYQSAHWLYGPPGTGKSSWSIFLSLLIGQDRFTELANYQNNFSNESMVGKSVLCLSDIITISPQTYKVVKPVLGRDFTKIEIKHGPKQHTLRQPCQLIFISNQDPHLCGNMMLDEAMVDKMIIVELNFVIPSDKMKGDLTPYMETIIPDIFAWSLLSNRAWLGEQIRARKINNTRKSLGLVPKTIFETFIEDQLAYSIYPATDVIPNVRTIIKKELDPEEVLAAAKMERKAQKEAPQVCNAFVTKNAFRDALELWIKQTGEEDKLKKAGGSIDKTSSFLSEAPTYFAKKIWLNYGIKSFEKKKGAVNGIEGIALKTEAMKKGEVDNELRPFLDQKRPAKQDMLEVSYKDALYGCYPFTIHRATKNKEVIEHTQRDLIRFAGKEEALNKLKRGEFFDDHLDSINSQQEGNFYPVINKTPQVVEPEFETIETYPEPDVKTSIPSDVEENKPLQMEENEENQDESDPNEEDHLKVDQGPLLMLKLEQEGAQSKPFLPLLPLELKGVRVRVDSFKLGRLFQGFGTLEQAKKLTKKQENINFFQERKRNAIKSCSYLPPDYDSENSNIVTNQTDFDEKLKLIGGQMIDSDPKSSL